MSIIEATGIDLTLGGNHILRDLSVTVEPGEVLALVGPNGAGKSTLLGILTGDLIPDRGTVSIQDKPLAQWKTLDLARTRAVLMQDNQVSFGFTAAQVVEMGRSPWAGRSSRDQDAELIDAAMRRTDTSALAERPYPVLSGGERARVCLARVLAQDTPVLFLDEPTAALDLRHQEEVMVIAREAAEAGRSVVVVLHDLSLAAAYSDRVVVIADGRLAACGTPEEVLTTELLAEVYGIDVHLNPDPYGHLVVTPDRGRGR